MKHSYFNSVLVYLYIPYIFVRMISSRVYFEIKMEPGNFMLVNIPILPTITIYLDLQITYPSLTGHKLNLIVMEHANDLFLKFICNLYDLAVDKSQ